MSEEKPLLLRLQEEAARLRQKEPLTPEQEEAMERAWNDLYSQSGYEWFIQPEGPKIPLLMPRPEQRTES